MAISPSSPTSRRSSLSSSTSSSAPPTFDALAPARPPTTVEAEETIIPIEGIPGGVRLKVDAGPGCGGIAWPAGEVLSRYLAYRHSADPTYLLNRNILELGSGTGLVGIAAGLLQEDTRICVTDQAPLLDLMQRNVELNLPERSHVRIAELNWGEAISGDIMSGTRGNQSADEKSGGHAHADMTGEGSRSRRVDMVLAADCVYFEPAFPLLVQTLCDLAPKGEDVEILFCWKKRRKADKRFFAMLKKHFSSTPIEDDRPSEKERYDREGVTLLKLMRTR